VQLYTHALSPFAAKVRIALDEKGIAYEELALPIRRSGIIEKPDELWRVNPRGEVPVLLDGDVRLYDSTVILEYLEERRPDPPLYPKGAAERARARQLEDFGDWLFTTSVNPLLDETFRKPDEAQRNTARLVDAVERIRHSCDRLERELGARDCFGGTFGVADIALYIPLMIASAFGRALDGHSAHPRLAAWFERTATRPSVAREVKAQMKALEELED
jgi:glutathione S-transferase